MQYTYLTDQGIGAKNEDSYLVTNNLFGIFDGATGLIKYADVDGSTGGLLASQTAKQIFENNPTIPLITSLETITNELKRKMREAHIPLENKTELWTTTASVIRVLDTSIEYAQIGDSPIVFIKKDGSIGTFYEDSDGETLGLWQTLVKEGVKDIRNDERMQNQLLSARRSINITNGALNGEKEALPFIKHGAILKDQISNILLFTDGMLIPQSDPSEPEDFQMIVKLYAEGGLIRIKEYVRQREDSDPNCEIYPRFKLHDDLTAIAIDF